MSALRVNSAREVYNGAASVCGLGGVEVKACWRRIGKGRPVEIKPGL
jgi:hypothetical protein